MLGLVLLAGGLRAQSAETGAQQGIGLRFAGNFHHFFKASDNPVIENWFSSGFIGASYKFYGAVGHAELGLGLGHKSADGSLPLVMNDFPDEDAQDAEITYLQGDIRFGPRVFWHVYPKFGVSFGYRTKLDGVRTQFGIDNGFELNDFYVNLPLGVSIDLPTSFGTTGFAIFYEIGISNTVNFPQTDDGTRLHGVMAEIHVLLRTR